MEISQKETYNAYKREQDAQKDGHSISYKTYRKVTSAFNSFLVDKMIYDGLVFNLGYRIGNICIMRSKRYYDKKNRNIDWNASKKLSEELGEWTYVYFTSDYKLYFEHFDPQNDKRYNKKKKGVLKILEYYRFKPTTYRNGLVKRAYRAVRQNELLLNKYLEKRWFITKKAPKES